MGVYSRVAGLMVARQKLKVYLLLIMFLLDCFLRVVESSSSDFSFSGKVFIRV